MSFNMNWSGDKVKALVHDQAVDAVFSAAELVLAEAGRKVPHDEGTLERSGETSIDTEKLIANVSYDTPYAARLHEHPEYAFQRGRTGKWLENAVNDNGDKVLAEMAAKLREVFK